MLSHARSSRRRSTSRITGIRWTRRRFAAAVAATALAAGLSAPAAGVDHHSVGQRYADGLDTRLSATALRDAAASVGYASTASTAGQSADQTWADGLGAAVMGLFGHANAGIFQVDEGATNAEDQFMFAGVATDVVSPYVGVRFFSEYLPYIDIDDMRLLVLAGCYTANRSSYGDFPSITSARGVDSVVTFPGLVYFPSTSPGAAASTTSYSGNYFWQRFSLHAGGGADVRTALSRARTDLVTKEGNAGGWDRYFVSGAVADPGRVRIRPSADGQPLDSDPLAAPGYTGATATTTGPYTRLSDLEVLDRHRTSAEEGLDGDALEVTTAADGVSYRMTASGRLVDVVGVATKAGEATLTLESAMDVARTFAATHGADLDGWVARPPVETAHAPGEHLAVLTWSPVTAGGVPGGEQIVVEVDLRSGAVVGYLHAQAADIASWPAAAMTETEARAAAARAVDVDGAHITAIPSVWNEAAWAVTVDHGIRGGLPDADVVVLDAIDGRVLVRTTT